MPLVGVRFTRHTEKGEEPLAEFRLDPNDPSKVIVVSGNVSGIAQKVLADGIETMYDAGYAVEIGQRYGVQMPPKSQVFTLADGVRLLIALMAVYKGNQYSGTYPVTA